MRNSLLVQVAALTLAGAAIGPAAAQTPPEVAASAPVTRDALPRDRTNQRVEHIRVEDGGSRVDEVRAGGETRSITVQPKAPVPRYEVQPADATGTGATSREAGPGAAGRRVWKVQEF